MVASAVTRQRIRTFWWSLWGNWVTAAQWRQKQNVNLWKTAARSSSLTQGVYHRWAAFYFYGSDNYKLKKQLYVCRINKILSTNSPFPNATPLYNTPLPPFSSRRCPITRACWRPLQMQSGIAQRKETRICHQTKTFCDTKRTNMEPAPLMISPSSLVSCWCKMVVKNDDELVLSYNVISSSFCRHS